MWRGHAPRRTGKEASVMYITQHARSLHSVIRVCP